jgi:hypothetical protein
MPIKFPCPSCKKWVTVKDELAGKKGRCSSCKQPLTVPTPPAGQLGELLPDRWQAARLAKVTIPPAAIATAAPPAESGS